MGSPSVDGPRADSDEPRAVVEASFLTGAASTGVTGAPTCVTAGSPRAPATSDCTG